MYERLKEFMKAAQANQELDAWNGDHDKVIKGFEESIQQLQAYREGHGFTGATGDAMNDWVDASIKRIDWYRINYERGYKSYEAGRKVMAAALAEAQTVSPHLLDAKTEAMRDDWVVAVSDEEPGGGVTFMGKRYTTGAAYVEAVEAQANAQREAAAERILAQMNAGTNRMSEGMRIGAPPSPSKVPGGVDSETGRDTPDNSSGGTPPIWDRTGDDSYGRDAERDPSSPSYPDGFKQPWWSEADAAAARNRIISSGAVPTRELPYGELGSRTNPISDPQDLMGTDLLHKSVNGTTYRNGVPDGHTPAPPADAQHPLWRLNGGAAADAATAGRLGGAGVLGAGALGMRGAARMGSGFGGLGGSARMGSGFGGLGGASGSAGGMGAGGMGGLRGISGTTGSAGAMGASNLRVGTYSGSGFGSYTPPASMTGANGAAGAGTSGVTGTTGAGGGAAGAAGAAGRGGAGAGGGFMGGGGAGAGAGMGKDDKKGRKRKYVAFTVDEDEDDLPAGYVNPLSQTYGTDRTIAPVKREDDGWDLRQW